MNVQIVVQPTLEPVVSSAIAPRQRKQSGIYQILCKLTGKVYVGSAVWLAKRKRHHREGLLSGSHENPYLQKAWDKYGPSAFEYSVLEYCDKEKLMEREQHHINKLRASDREHGYNLCSIAYSNLGRTFGQSMRDKISVARKNKGGTLSPTQTEALRERMKGNSLRLGIKHTPETCERLKESRKGKQPALGMRHTDDFKKALSERLKGKPLSVEHRKKIAQSNTGRPRTLEHTRKLAFSLASIPTDQCETIRSEYTPGIITMRDLATRYGCNAQTICNVIHRKGVAYR